MWGEAAKKLADVVNDNLFKSLEGKTKHQLWLELCDIITKHPQEVKHLKVDAILRSGIRNFKDEVSLLPSSHISLSYVDDLSSLNLLGVQEALQNIFAISIRADSMCL